jgi:hypothetical protein
MEAVSEAEVALPGWCCPLPQCGWTHAQPPPDAMSPGPVVPVLPGEGLDEAISRASAAILREWYAGAEVVIEAHLGTHTTLEWVTEVMRLRGEADALRGVARTASEWDALVMAAAPMSYVMDARELERRERDAEQAVRDAVEAARESGLDF